MLYSWIDDTPIGRLLIAGTKDRVKYLAFDDGSTMKREQLAVEEWEESSQPFREAIRQIKAYFAGNLQEFDVALDADGTDFQKKVWAELCSVPYGETVSYGEIARAIGQPTASRAVGMANGRNPISIIVPCHRIIGSNGKLVGYGGGLRRKTTLLRLEGAVA